MSSNNQAIFPDYPRESPVLDKDGNFTALWDLGLSALFQALQVNFKNEGIVFPPLTQSQLTTIASLYTYYIGQSYNKLTENLPDITGQTAFNSDTNFTNQFVIAVDGSNLVTMAQWVPLGVQLIYNGDPNGNVAGFLNWLCLNTASTKLYACTASGSAATATWTLI